MSVEYGKRSLWQDFKGLKRLWPYLYNDRKLIIIAALLIPVIAVLQASLPLIISHAIDKGISQNDPKVIATGSLGLLVISILVYVTRSSQSLIAALAVHRMVRNLRNKIVAHIMTLKCSYHDKTLSGTLVTRATSDFDNMGESLNMGVLTAIVDIAVLVGCLSGLFLLDWRLALIAVAILPLVSITITGFSRVLKGAMLRARTKIAVSNAFAQECLYGIRVIKLLLAKKAATRKFHDLNIDYRNAQMKSVVFDASMFAVLEGFAVITMGVLLWVSLRYVMPNFAISTGVLVAFITYIQQLFEPLKHLGNKIAMLQGAFTSMDRIFGILETHSFIEGNEKPPINSGKLTISNLSFTYTETPSNEAAQILKNVNLSLPDGDSLAIVGPTGSGKSTIIKLLTKLYDGYEGEILIDNHNMKDIDGDYLRKEIAIVPQDIVLFDGSIEFNISLGDERISEAVASKAATSVGLGPFIASLPNGIKTQVKEQGSNLSFGQRQLISFARALAKDPKIIVLDEATSSVDPASERLVQKAIDSMFHDRSLIVIAHRLSTIEKCNQIAVLQNGIVVEIGTHQELVAKKGVYSELRSSMAQEQEAVS